MSARGAGDAPQLVIVVVVRTAATARICTSISGAKGAPQLGEEEKESKALERGSQRLKNDAGTESLSRCKGSDIYH